MRISRGRCRYFTVLQSRETSGTTWDGIPTESILCSARFHFSKHLPRFHYSNTHDWPSQVCLLPRCVPRRTAECPLPNASGISTSSAFKSSVLSCPHVQYKKSSSPWPCQLPNSKNIHLTFFHHGCRPLDDPSRGLWTQINTHPSG